MVTLLVQQGDITAPPVLVDIATDDLVDGLRGVSMDMTSFPGMIFVSGLESSRETGCCVRDK